ncbi:methionine synthase [Anoxybacter fermentans]|uniref:Methionine synthase n=1 Tax=Anoxybacter fermentans TaxID=1323375 RepID=A0A3S9SXH2_9FIRM|nr:cobalamin B12-binding domain-containing protein [Anoxybacter fermentans]AZR72985.1 methionine synthase [Anoxybacter fermentans]
MRPLILGAALGNCVHVGGVLNFLRLAEDVGYRTKFLGPAVSIKDLIGAIIESEPEMVAVGYRLTPETGFKLFNELKNAVLEAGLTKPRYIFGGTIPVAKEAAKVGLFERIFTGEEGLDEIIAFLKGEDRKEGAESYPDNLVDRIKAKAPFPVIRHHFGLPSLEETIAGIEKIAEAKVLDVISLGPDQNAQESFFRPEEMDPKQSGAGGVPIRTEDDLRAIYKASRRGNYPLLRCYSGTRDLLKMAEMLKETINNAWCAVPLSWYNQLDGRGPRPVAAAIAENQQVMKWHGERNIPVEVNEAHHWSLRDAHDTIAVVMAYLAAYNAKKMGVKDYVAQYMFNTPPGTSGVMDLAKMLAKKELITSLEDENFKVYTQVRAGLSSFPVDMDMAKGQLNSSTYLAMALKPDIVHVVAYCEADHAATPDDIIESCKMVRQVIQNCLFGLPDMTCDPRVQERKKELLNEAQVLLNAIKKLGQASGSKDDPFTDPENLAHAIKIGLLDAPHLKGNPNAKGALMTKMVNGACYAYDFTRDHIITEEERIKKIIF